MVRRRDALGLIGAALLLPSCTARSRDAVRIGSTGSTENAIIAEIYAAALRRANVKVERETGLDGDPGALTALQHGDIDLYPGHVGLRFQDVAPGVIALASSPVYDSPCLATSQYTAEQYYVLTLSECAQLAPQLRLAASADFLAPGGALERLQRFYDGFRFKSIATAAPGAQYYALNRGDAKIANAFTTDPDIAEDQLVILRDDKQFWPQTRVAPIVRKTALNAHPRLPRLLDPVSAMLTEYAVQQMNMRAHVLKMDASDVADDFLRRIPSLRAAANGRSRAATAR